jgi:hypothetical protein
MHNQARKPTKYAAQQKMLIAHCQTSFSSFQFLA